MWKLITSPPNTQGKILISTFSFILLLYLAFVLWFLYTTYILIWYLSWQLSHPSFPKILLKDIDKSLRLIRLKWGFDKNHYNCRIRFIFGSYMCVFVLIYVTLCAFINILLHMIDFGTLIQLCGCFIMHIWFNMCSHVIMCFGIAFCSHT